MDSNTITISQDEWDSISKSLSDIFGVDYTPSLCPEPIHYQTANGGFNIGDNINQKTWILSHVNGISLTVNNLSKFCRDYGLNENKMRAVSKGHKRQYKGWTVLVENEPIPDKLTKPRKDYRKAYTIIDPNGVVHNVLGLSQFCKENGLHTGTMSMVANGKYNAHKGWKCEYKHNPT